MGSDAKQESLHRLLTRHIGKLNRNLNQLELSTLCYLFAPTCHSICGGRISHRYQAGPVQIKFPSISLPTHVLALPVVIDGGSTRHHGRCQSSGLQGGRCTASIKRVSCQKATQLIYILSVSLCFRVWCSLSSWGRRLPARQHEVAWWRLSVSGSHCRTSRLVSGSLLIVIHQYLMHCPACRRHS